MYKRITKIAFVAIALAALTVIPQISHADNTTYWQPNQTGVGYQQPLYTNHNRPYFYQGRYGHHHYCCRVRGVTRLHYPRWNWTSPIGFQTLLNSQYGGTFGPSYRVITDQASLTQVWRRVTGNPNANPPYVDFNRSMVLMASLGQQRNGGYSVRISGISHNANRLRVRVEARGPAASGVYTQALTSPVHLVVVPRMNMPVDFVVTNMHAQYGWR